MKKSVILFVSVILFFGATGQEESKENFTMKPALLVIDVQKQFTPMMSQGDMDRALQMMNWSM